MDSEQNFIPQSSENIVSKLWAKYFPYWPVFLLIIALATGGAWLYLQFKLPVYQSSASLLIKDEKRGIEESKTIESLNPLSSKKIIENETEIIKSRALMNQVVLTLKLYAPIFEKAKWKDHSAYTVSPIKIEVQSPDSLTEVQRVNFSYDASTTTVNFNGHSYALNQWVNTPWGNLRFSVNNLNYRFQAPLYFALIHPKRVIQNLSSSLEVTPVGKLSTVINLKIKDEVPKRSEEILNTLIGVYSKAAINDKNTLAANTLSFLDERLKYVSADLASIEKQLQQYRANKGAIDISSQGRLFLQNVSENDQKLSNVNMKMAILNQVEQFIFSNNSNDGLVPTTLGMDEPILTNLLNKLYELEQQYDKLKLSAGENNPETVSLSNQIQQIKPNILGYIRSQKKSLELNKTNLYTTNNAYNSLLQALPQQEKDIVEISREQNIKSSIYSFLLQKREEAALSYSSTVPDSRVVDKAESSLDPVSSESNIVYLVAAMLAIGVGIALITVRELFNRTILFRQEIEALTSFPVIGEIALEKSKAPLVLENRKTSFIAEEFRMLRTSLQYLGIGSKGKKILITSTVSGEGKSFIAANLAMSLAIGEKKVVLVEFDLSNPTLSDKLGIKGGKGLADYLMGDVEVSEVIRRTGDNANLFILTAGNLPDNPSELILHQRTADLIQYLENLFDYVLVDSAPIGLLSDGYVLSRYCDATLFVVRHGHTPKKMLERLEQNNKINELKNLAIVFNGVRSRGFGLNSYGYGYGHIYSQKQNKKRSR